MNISEHSNLDNKLKLLLQTVYIDSESAWLAGYVAAQNDIWLESNPFASNDEEFEIWQNGWWSGFYEEKPLYETAEIENADFTNTSLSTEINALYFSMFSRVYLSISIVLTMFALITFVIAD